MQKHPTFGRFALVAILAIWTLSEWYPPQGKNMVDEFDQTAQGNQDSIVAELKEASSKLREGDELTLETWMTAVGDVDLGDVPGQTNGIVKQIGIEKEAWVAPTEEQQRQINREILARIQKDSVGKVKLGLDLRGGTQFVVQVKPKLDDEGNPLSIDESQLTKAMEIMRRRVDRFGVAEPMIQTSGDDKIIIQVPGLSQADRDDARETISQVAKLEFRLTPTK